MPGSDLSGPLTQTNVDMSVQCIESLSGDCQTAASALDELTGAQERKLNEARNSIAEANDALKMVLAIGIIMEFVIVLSLHMIAIECVREKCLFGHYGASTRTEYAAVCCQYNK